MEVVELSKFEAYQNGLYKLSEGEAVVEGEIIKFEKPSNYLTWDFENFLWVEDLETLRKDKEQELENSYSNHVENHTFSVTLTDGREVQQGISDSNRDDLSQLITSLNNEINLRIYNYVDENGTEPTPTEKLEYMKEATSFYIFRTGEMAVPNLLELQEIGCLINKEYKGVYIANEGYKSMIYTKPFNELLELEFTFEDRTE